uniref:Putative tubulin beta 2 n=1 Tax=Taeniopygia guttata TaxID=59729 RepID=B5G4G6_TAEGU|nr:putative tubulin beta 2 [Taeniopygia guttata]
MASTPPAPTTGTATCSWSASMSTTTRPQAASTCPAPCWWTWSPAPWTRCAPGLSGRSSGRTTSCSVIFFSRKQLGKGPLYGRC